MTLHGLAPLLSPGPHALLSTSSFTQHLFSCSALDPLASLLLLKCTKHAFVSESLDLFFPGPEGSLPNICSFPSFFQVFTLGYRHFIQEAFLTTLFDIAIHAPPPCLGSFYPPFSAFFFSIALPSNISYLFIVSLFTLKCKQEMLSVLNTAIS